MSLTWGQLDLDAGVVTVSGEKTRTPRTVALAPDVVDLLRERPRGIGAALVFPSPNAPGKPTDLRSAFATALRRAAIENFRWHDLRHSAASYMAMEGATSAEIAGVLGHRTLQMVGRYAHLSPQHVAQASTRIADRMRGRQGR
jgi:integrase